MDFKSISESLKHAIFVEEPDSTAPLDPSASMGAPHDYPAQITTSVITSSTTLPPAATLNPELAGEDAAGVSQLLEALREKTDFDKTEVGQQLAEHIAPLADLPLSDAQKLGVALKAGQKEGLTGARILSTLGALKSQLQQEQAAFNHSVEQAMAAEVDSRKAKIQAEANKQAELKAKIAESQKVQSDLSTEMINAQSNIQRKQAQFRTAFDSRVVDLDTAISKYSSLLPKG
jgi:hypothetical protein